MSSEGGVNNSSSDEDFGTNPPEMNPSGSGLVSDVVEAVDHFRERVVDKSLEMRDMLENLRGKIFHAVTSNNVVLQYKVGNDGKVTLLRTIESLNSRTIESLHDKANRLREARGKLIKAGKEVPIK